MEIAPFDLIAAIVELGPDGEERSDEGIAPLERDTVAAMVLLIVRLN